MSVGETQNKLFEEAVSELETLDARLFERILNYLSEITTDGVLTPDSAQLAQIEQKIRQWTFEFGYPEIVDNYLKGLDAVNEINKAYYEGNNRVKSAIENEIINSDLNNEYRKQVVETLRGAGAYDQGIAAPGEDDHGPLRRGRSARAPWARRRGRGRSVGAALAS